MMLNRTSPLVFLTLLLTSGIALAGPGDLSVQDPTITINPVVRQFPVTTLGDSSAPAQFTVTNLSGSGLAIGPIDIIDSDPAQYDLIGHTCPATLGAGESCTVSVSFSPTSKGTKTALLQVASGSATTPVISAYLTNSIGASVEAQQRMPPTLSSVTIANPMTTGNSYDISWTLQGYDSTYQSYVALYDCTGVPAGSCGNNINDPTVAESPLLAPTTTSDGNWSYGGVLAKKFTYTWSYAPDKRTSGGAEFDPAGTDIVVRFYQKSDIDVSRNNASVSLLIPGNQGTTYYDTAGRRILIKIQKAP
jgi:hypothetical protein